jgi:hypothetical protein
VDRPLVFQVIGQSFDQRAREREREKVLAFNGLKGHHSPPPVEVFKAEHGDFTGAHAETGNHQDYGEVAFPSAVTSVDASQ